MSENKPTPTSGEQALPLAMSGAGSSQAPTEQSLPFLQQLRWSLVLYLVLLTVLPVIVAVSVVLVRTSSQAREQVFDQLDSVAELKQDQIIRWVEENELALNLFLSGRDREGQFASQLQRPVPERAQSLTEVLEGGLEENPLFIKLFVYDISGNIVLSTDESDLGKVVTSQPYFEKSLPDGYVQPPYYGLGSGELEMYVARPIVNQGGWVVGMLTAQLDVSTLADIMTNRTGLGATGETYLVSAENNYLLTPGRFEGYEPIRAYHSTGIDRALAGEGGRDTYTNYRRPSRRVFGAYRYIPELQAALLAEIEQSQALVATQQAQAAGIGMAVVATLAAFVIGLTLARQISEPVSSLTETVLRVAGGELDLQAEVTSGNEVGVLASAFNAMTGQLRDLIGSLEERVEARTRDLATTIEVGQLATSIFGEEELLPKIVEFIRERFNLYYTQIYLLDEAGRYALMRAGSGDVGRQLAEIGHHLDLNATSIVASAVRDRRSVLVANTLESEIHLPNPLLPNTRSELAIPLETHGETIGVLDMQAAREGTFNPENQPVFEAMANQLAATLRGARAFEEAQAAIERAEAINRRLTGEAWRTYLGRVAEGERVAYHYDLEAPRPVEGEVSLSELAIQQDASETYLQRPISLRGQQIGTILVGENQEREWTDEEVALIDDVAGRVAQATDQYRAFDELAERERRLEGFSERLRRLQEITQSLAAELTPDEETYRSALAGMAGLLDAAYAALIILDREGNRERFIHYGTSNKIAERFSALIEGQRAEDEAALQAALQAFLIVPVFAEERTVGRVYFAGRSGGTFGEDDEALANSFVAVLGRTLQAIDLYQESETRARELETVAEVSAQATTALEVQALLENVANLTKERFGLYHTHIYLLDEAGQQLVLAAGAGNVGRIMAEQGHAISLDHKHSIVARCARSRESVIVNDVTQTPDHLPNPLLPDTQSEAATPLVVGDKLIGVLDVQSDQLNRFTENDIRVQETLAAQIAVAIQNARTFEQVEESQGLLRSVLDASTDWIWAKDHTFHYILCNRLFAEQLYGTSPEEIIGKDDYDIGVPPELIEGDPERGIRGFRPDDEAAIAGEIVHNPYDVVLFTDGSEHIFDTVKIPLHDYEGNVIGTLGIGRDVTEREDVRRRQLAAYEIAQQLTTLLDPQMLLRQTLERLSDTFGYYHAHVYLPDETGEMLTVYAGLGEAGAMMEEQGHSIPLNAELSLVARAGRTLEAVVVNNVAAAPDYLPNPLLPETKSEVAVPLVAGERLVGVLDVQHNVIGHFDDDEVRTLGIVGNQLSVAMQNAYLFEQAQDALAQTEALYAGSDQVVRATTASEVLEALVESTVLQQFDRVNLLFFSRPWRDEPPETATVAAVWEQSGEAPVAPPGTVYTMEQVRVVGLLAGGGPVAISDALTDERMDEGSRVTLQKMGMRSVVGFRLEAGGQWFGFITAQAADVLKIEEDDIRQINSLVDQAATVLESIRLFERTQEALAQTEVLYSGSDRVVRATTASEVLEALVESTALQRLDRANIFFFEHPWGDKRPETAMVAAVWERSGGEPLGPVGTVYPLDRIPAVGQLVKGGPIIVHDTLADERIDESTRAALQALGMRSTVGFRLEAGGQWFGFATGQSSEVLDLTEDDARQINSLMDQAATVLESLRLFERTQEALSQTEVLLIGSERVSHATTFGEVLDAAIVTTALQQLDRVSILLFEHAWDEDDKPETVTAAAVWERSGKEPMLPAGTVHAVEQFPVIDRLTPDTLQIIEDMNTYEHADEHMRQVFVEQLGMRGLASFPLVTGGQWIGFLLGQSTEALQMSEENIRQIVSVAGQAAARVQNIRLFEQALDTAQQLREVDRLKTEFLATMSHELRTPLNSIIGYSELLIDELGESVDDMSVDDLRAIHSSGHHLLAIINDILDLAKIEAGRLELNVEIVNVETLIPQLVDMSRVLLREKPEVELEIDLDENLPNVEVDTVRLRQIIWNLLSNAIKFTDEGHVRLSGWAEDGWLYVAVEDTGIGIPKQYQQAIFDQFRQVDGSATRKAGGTGLGLTITRQLVTLHNGDLWVESTVNKGSTFTFKVPITQSAQPEPVDGEEQAEKQPADGKSTNGKRPKKSSKAKAAGD
jgi:PAS domain S-box-containing protein